eukprot:SAG31_NODE_434_length_15737_cov_10.315450_6_plen_65_part_00
MCKKLLRRIRQRLPFSIVHLLVLNLVGVLNLVHRQVLLSEYIVNLGSHSYGDLLNLEVIESTYR